MSCTVNSIHLVLSFNVLSKYSMTGACFLNSFIPNANVYHTKQMMDYSFLEPTTL